MRRPSGLESLDTERHLELAVRAVLGVGDGHVVDGVEAALRDELLEQVHEAGGARVQAEEEALQAVLVRVPVALLLRLVVEVGALCTRTHVSLSLNSDDECSEV